MFSADANRKLLLASALGFQRYRPPFAAYFSVLIGRAWGKSGRQRVNKMDGAIGRACWEWKFGPGN
jgi:hypothetical protein